jgi:Tfp pilus assembly protein PilF
MNVKEIKMKKFIYLLTAVSLIFLLTSCSQDEPISSDEEYNQIINAGWNAFKIKNFDAARAKFGEALYRDSSKIMGYVGLGWCFMKQDSMQFALLIFQRGAINQNVTASLLAGYAFSLNAVKLYFHSNERVDQALLLDPTWVFAYDSTLDRKDLTLLKAENFFQLGDFPNSLAQVKILNPLFNANVSTVLGQASLAIEIERLKLII